MCCTAWVSTELMTAEDAAAEAEHTSPVSHTSESANHNGVLALVAVAQFMVILDATVVNVAIPTIKRDLGFSEESLSWILNAYTLMFGGFLLLGGRAADRLGRRRMFLAGITVFATASLMSGLSNSAAMLLIARGAQGLGGALVSPAALSIILTTFTEGHARNRALAIWGAIAGSGGAVGLVVGGSIVQTIGWRWVFFINVPIGAALLALTPRIVPESRSEARGQAGYDVEGAIAITAGTLALVFTLIEANSWGWDSYRTIAGFTVAAFLIAAFLIIERRHKDPLVPLRIFANRSLAASDATFLLVAAALFGVFFFNTLYLQQVLGYTPLETGLASLPLSVSIIGASIAVSRVLDRFTPKSVLVTGLVITAGGLSLLSQVSGHGDYASHVLPAMVVLGLGLGMSFVPVTIAATTGVAPSDSGLASGLLNTTQQVGGSIGLAVLSAISATREADAVHGGASLSAALTHGFKGSYTAALLLCAAGAILALVLLPRRKRAVENEELETVAMSFVRCPGAPYCGHLGRAAALARRLTPATRAKP